MTTDKYAGKTVSIRHISCILFASTTVDYVYIAHIHTACQRYPASYTRALSVASMIDTLFTYNVQWLGTRRVNLYNTFVG